MPNELHTMPLRLEALYSSLSFRSMRWDEKGAYLLLLCEMWLKGGLSLPCDDIPKVALSDATHDELARIRENVFNKMFPVNAEGYHCNDTQLSIYNATLKRVQKFKQSGRKGGLRQAQGRLKHPNPNPNPNPNSHSECEKEPAQNIFVEYPKTWEEVKRAAEIIGYDISQLEAENFLAKGQSKGWKDGKSNIMDWRKLLMVWKNSPRRGGTDPDWMTRPPDKPFNFGGKEP